MSNNFTRTLRALRTDGWSGWTIRALVAALLLVAWGIWFFWGRITVWAVSETARAEVREEAFSVEAPVEGRVARVHISRGQQVSEGDLLVELETFKEEGERDALAEELDGLRIQQTELETRIAGERRALDLSEETHRASVVEASSNVEQAESAALLTRQEEDRMRRLRADDLASQGDLDKAVAAREQAEAQVRSLQAAASGIDRRHAVDREERQTGIDRLTGELRVLQTRIRSTETTIDRLDQEVGLRRIQAPSSGVLARVDTLREGAVVDVGDVLARIVPSGRIGATAFFEPAEAVGRIRKGQRARMRLDGFPSTQFGTVPATVAVVDSETTNGRIRVGFDFSEEPTAIDVQHGMVGSLEVEVDRLSPAEMLLRAVGKLLDRPGTDEAATLADAD